MAIKIHLQEVFTSYLIPTNKLLRLISTFVMGVNNIRFWIFQRY